MKMENIIFVDQNQIWDLFLIGGIHYIYHQKNWVVRCVYDVEDEYIENVDGKMKFGTHLFVIKEDGTIGAVGEDNYYVVESVKKI